mmetsp:Transcript_18151/g.24197  ORF Transcript_18151/g.24197 Transcript_18151/m.24197 type:complete len:237 (+) Transcript_18151:138-848(+)
MTTCYQDCLEQPPTYISQTHYASSTIQNEDDDLNPFSNYSLIILLIHLPNNQHVFVMLNVFWKSIVHGIVVLVLHFPSGELGSNSVALVDSVCVCIYCRNIKKTCYLNSIAQDQTYASHTHYDAISTLTVDDASHPTLDPLAFPTQYLILPIHLQESLHGFSMLPKLAENIVPDIVVLSTHLPLCERCKNLVLNQNLPEQVLDTIIHPILLVIYHHRCKKAYGMDHIPTPILLGMD